MTPELQDFFVTGFECRIPPIDGDAAVCPEDGYII